MPVNQFVRRTFGSEAIPASSGTYTSIAPGPGQLVERRLCTAPLADNRRDDGLRQCPTVLARLLAFPHKAHDFTWPDALATRDLRTMVCPQHMCPTYKKERPGIRAAIPV